MTAILINIPARPAPRFKLPAVDTNPFKARVARLICVPRAMPGRWIV